MHAFSFNSLGDQVLYPLSCQPMPVGLLSYDSHQLCRFSPLTLSVFFILLAYLIMSVLAFFNNRLFLSSPADVKLCVVDAYRSSTPSTMLVHLLTDAISLPPVGACQFSLHRHLLVSCSSDARRVYSSISVGPQTRCMLDALASI